MDQRYDSFDIHPLLAHNHSMDSFALVIFGITSNLAQAKLIPAIYDLERRNLLPQEMTIIGIARSTQNDVEHRQFWKETISSYDHHGHTFDQVAFERLFHKIHYLEGDVSDNALFDQLKTKIEEHHREKTGEMNTIYYLATFPELYQTIFDQMHSHGLTKQEQGWTRVMIEKPVGHDYASAVEVNNMLGRYFEEDQIYRLDHYLGKETLLNILYFRFTNHIFEPLMNNEYVDHIQITAAEDFGIHRRGRYYDSFGALKDVGQNHLLQMLTFATMNCPGEFSNDGITRQRIDLLQCIQPEKEHILFGQYEGFREEEYIAKDSTTDTFFAFKAKIENERWNGVPIYLRGGKRLAQTVTEISVVFKEASNAVCSGMVDAVTPNALIFRIQPNEGIVLKMTTKNPGTGTGVEETYMQYCYRGKGNELPTPHENLILNAFMGDQTYFIDAPEVERQWQITDALSEMKKQPIIYAPGTWGPTEANTIIEEDGRKWLEPSMAFCAL